MWRVTVHMVDGKSFATSLNDHALGKVREAIGRLPRTGLLSFDGDMPQVTILMDKITMVEFVEEK